MNSVCSKIVFSNRAYNSIISETCDKIKTETGGILLGRIIENIWYVVEVIDPGPNSVFTVTYFEYDTAYVNHLAKVISKQYQIELAVLGLWHRHPGSMDTFSSKDDETNSQFSRLHSKGAISGLINIDPNLRLTMYHVSLPLKYTLTAFEIGDDIFPQNLLAFKFSEVNPSFFSKYEHFKPTEKSKLRKNVFNKIFNSIFRKHVTAGGIKSYLNRNVSETNKSDDDILVDMYVSEEILLENSLRVKCESEVESEKITYFVNEFIDGQPMALSILFSVNLDVKCPMFYCGKKEFRFTEGIFTRYVKSKINNSEFFG